MKNQSFVRRAGAFTMKSVATTHDFIEGAP
jgi:hypothetical protein